MVQMWFEGAGHGREMIGIKVVVISQLQIVRTSCGLTELLDDATLVVGDDYRLRTGPSVHREDKGSHCWKGEEGLLSGNTEDRET